MSKGETVVASEPKSGAADAPSDAEVICAWMEPKPDNRTTNVQTNWWMFLCLDSGWVPRKLTLDRLWEVEERLTEKQRGEYYFIFWERRDRENWWTLLHATSEQKIKALAAVIREGASALPAKGDTAPAVSTRIVKPWREEVERICAEADDELRGDLAEAHRALTDFVHALSGGPMTLGECAGFARAVLAKAEGASALPNSGANANAVSKENSDEQG